MSLYEYVGKKIKVVCTTGEAFVGKCTSFTQALDNEPEVDSISIDTLDRVYEIYENEIKSIAEIK